MVETAHLSGEANTKLNELMIKSLEKIAEYYESPNAAKANLVLEIKTANNLVSSISRIRQSESGSEMVRLQIGRALSSTKEEFKEFLQENMPHLALEKRLKP